MGGKPRTSHAQSIFGSFLCATTAVCSRRKLLESTRSPTSPSPGIWYTKASVSDTSSTRIIESSRSDQKETASAAWSYLLMSEKEKRSQSGASPSEHSTMRLLAPPSAPPPPSRTTEEPPRPLRAVRLRSAPIVTSTFEACSSIHLRCPPCRTSYPLKERTCDAVEPPHSSESAATQSRSPSCSSSGSSST